MDNAGCRGLNDKLSGQAQPEFGLWSGDADECKARVRDSIYIQEFLDELKYAATHNGYVLAKNLCCYGASCWFCVCLQGVFAVVGSLAGIV